MKQAQKRWVAALVFAILPLPFIYKVWSLWGQPQPLWLAELWAPFALMSAGAVFCADWALSPVKADKSVKIKAKGRSAPKRRA